MLETLYFLAQILAAFAVVGSLVFVGLQIRGNTKEQGLTRANEAVENYERFQLILIENPEFREIWIKGADDIKQLAPSELLAFGAYMALWVTSAQKITAQMKAGYATISWENVKAAYRPVTNRKGAFQWWQKARGSYQEDVRERLDDIFSDAHGPKE
ncbi:MAG: hypothetical protein V7744_20840 [Pseudomonadales bacterium]